ncbi:hypothetical protein [Granulicella arctica]|uniref:Uncharacterized protein n=1 Tax=Granulicella arctica TaxID=940613 RepID=A0A7Y9PF67_9BACT|nr:hypothetical protein [Granulicella arctica]NYF78048.1 hypothetical protein [Granulicella arctica]
MNASNERVFYYHADASPLGGYLTHPFESVLPTHASVSLSQAGGHVAARAENIRLDDLISCGAAYSQISGSVQPITRNWTTLVTAVVEDLNVLEIVTADRIVSRLAIEHPRDGYYPKVSVVGSQYENLRIGGRSVTPTVDLDLFSAPVADQKPRFAVEGDMLPAEAAPSSIGFPDRPWPDVGSFTRRAVEQNERMTSATGVPTWLKRRYEWMESAEARSRKGYALCSLVQEVHGTAPGSTFGHIVHVPGLGNVFLGELVVAPSSFSLTMLRIEMGCVADGTVSLASTRGNGYPMP